MEVSFQVITTTPCSCGIVIFDQPLRELYRKKYRKMRLQFEDKMRDSDTLFKREQAAIDTARRLAQSQLRTSCRDMRFRASLRRSQGSGNSWTLIYDTCSRRRISS